MAAKDIIDPKTLERWLKARPKDRHRADSIAIAQRAAARVFPVWAAAMAQDWARRSDLTALPVLRPLLTAGVARKYPTPEVIAFSAAAAAAARSAAAADAFSDARSAARSAAAAAAAAFSADAADARSAAAFSAAVFSADAAKWMPSSAFFDHIRKDAETLDGNGDPFSNPLWDGPEPDGFFQSDTAARAIWAADPPARWSFWTRWWDGVISGQQLDWELQRRVALIPDAIWQSGPDAVAEAIRRIEEELGVFPGDDFERRLDKMAVGSTATLRKYAERVWEHRNNLPATFDAIIGYCSLEIEHLQKRNFRDDDEKDEVLRQIHVLATISDAVERLRQSMPLDKPMSEEAAKLPEKLTRLVFNTVAEWPRKNVEDMVDSGYKAAIFGSVAFLGIQLGLPPQLATIGGLIFAGKKIADALKGGKDAS